MSHNRDLKRIARQNLTGNYRIPMGVFVVAELIPFVLELPFSELQTDNSSLLQTFSYFGAVLLISLIGVVLNAGQQLLHLNLARNKEYNFFLLFSCFKNHPDRYLILGFLMTLLAGVMALPIVVGYLLWFYAPGALYGVLAVILCILGLALLVFLRIRFSLLYFTAVDHPEMSIREVFRSNKQLMKGRMGSMFFIYLAYFGLNVLSVLSLCIGYLWVCPYQNQLLAVFYLDAIGELPSYANETANAFNQQYNSKEESFYE
jgi:uncharacterized membrane protein